MNKSGQKWGKILVLLVWCVWSTATAAQKPNIVFFLIDDMGYKDLGCFGAELYETPHIDQLCAEGVKFSRAYVPVSICSPTRASVMTGKHCTNLKMWNHTHYIPPSEKIIPAFLKEEGYQTWHVGKWHMGNPAEKTMPLDLGFDVNVGGFISWGPGSYFWPYGSGPDGEALPIPGRKNKDGTTAYYWDRNRVPGLYAEGESGEYLTDRLTDEALKLIDQRRADQPFFLNLWHYAVHGPQQGKPNLVEKYKKKIQTLQLKPTYRIDPVTQAKLLTSETSAVFAAMIESVDDSVGRVVTRLKENGTYDNTLFIFFSDNGPTTENVPCAPFRGGKNTNYEAGVRVPAFMVWPGHTQPGSTYDRIIRIEDVFDTILGAAGVVPEKIPENDGRSLFPVFCGDQLPMRQPWWFFPRDVPQRGQRASAAILDEKSGMKYFLFFNGDEPELYNLKTDEEEEHNVVSAFPEVADRLRKALLDNLTETYPDLPKNHSYDQQVRALLLQE